MAERAVRARFERHPLLAISLALCPILVGSFLAASLADGALAAESNVALERARGSPPNVVVLLSDDQTVEQAQYLPVLQAKLMSQGITFANAMVPNSLCCPSRSSILTGDYSSTTGVWDNDGPNGGFQTFTDLGDDRSTLATWLHGAGYRTGLFGKYLNGYGATDGSYRPPGWDSWYAYTQAGYYDFQLTHIEKDSSAVETFNGDDTARTHGDAPYAPDYLAQRAIDFIGQTSDPFLVYYAPFSPHKAPTQPVAVPSDADRGSFADLPPWRPPNYNEADMSDKPTWMRRKPVIDDATAAELHAERISMVEALQSFDRDSGAIIDAVAAKGELNNTLFIFLSDNGYLFGEHRDEGKNSPYDAAVRVPMAIRYDPLTSGTAGGTSAENVLNIDLAPTIYDLVGLNKTPRMDGESLAPLLSDPSADIRNRFLLEGGDSSPRSHPPYCGARNQDSMYVRYADGQAEFYNYGNDRYELKNLISSRSPNVQKRISQLKTFAKDNCSPAYPGYQWRS